MTRFVDLVNFNADASCLPASDWLDALSGGAGSRMCQWLGVYVEARRRVVIGFTGATLADMVVLNPEAVQLVNDHPEIFEVVLRSFSHDIALLRSPAGFAFNMQTGRAAIEREFRKVAHYFLPAEFMLTNAQVRVLGRSGVLGTFVNASRFKNELQSRIPDEPYFVRGIYSSRLRCIPVQGALSEAYLRSLHFWDSVSWNQALKELPQPIPCSWRDGESFLFVPDGIERERAWLHGESDEVERLHLSEAEAELVFRELDNSETGFYRSYPVHSFSDWIKEFRMLGYLNRLNAQEQHVDTFDLPAKVLWLSAIGSDVFSAVEKQSPVVALRTAPQSHRSAREISWTIRRSERGFEGEEFLEMLEAHQSGLPLQIGEDHATTPHMRKLRAREEYLKGMLA